MFRNILAPSRGGLPQDRLLFAWSQPPTQFGQERSCIFSFDKNRRSPMLLQFFFVLGVTLALLVTEWLPADLTALATAVLLMLLGLVTPEQGVSGFSNTATITVMAMFVLSAGITRTGVMQVAQDLLANWGGKSPARQVFVMGALAGPISGFINNTAVVAVFLPLVEDWCSRTQQSPSKFLMPLSYATVLGGMLSLVGTSTNLLASGLSIQLGYGGFGLFQFTRLGVILLVLGLIYLALASPYLLYNRRPAPDLAAGYGLDDFVSEVAILPESRLVGSTLKQSQLQRQFDLDVLEIIRDGMRFSQPIADKTLRARDILLVRGRRDEVLKIRQEQGLDLVPDVKFGSFSSALSSEEEGIAEVLILSNSRLVGSTLKDLRFRQRYNATVLAIRRGQEVARSRLGQVPLRFGDLLLLQGPQQSLLGLQTSRELLLLSQREADLYRRDKAIAALAITIAVVGISALGWVPLLPAALAGALLMVVTGCLKPGEVYGAVRWDTIFLLSGFIPLGIAMENSGATAWLASGLAAVGSQLPGYWVLVALYGVTAVLTEILSNSAVVVVMVPIAAEVARAVGMEPLMGIFTVTFAASNSFMTPIGYQTNAMVYGPGGYRFSDFLRMGAPITATLTFLTPWLILQLYRF